MNRSKILKELIFLLILIVTPLMLVSQVPVERSRDRVVIAGISYYIHLVKKGETLYSVSRAYGISAVELIKENPASSDGLKEGQSIRIRVSMVDSAPVLKQTPSQATVKDHARYVYHQLKQGETVYFLSKQYGVTKDDIISSNPGIDISKLPLGYEVAIPRKKTGAYEPVNIRQKQDAFYHKVLKGETIYSISRKYGITARQLRNANNDIRFPQVGDYLKIPGMKAEISEPEVINVADTVPESPPEEPVYIGKPDSYTPVTNLSGSFNVAILLPFYLAENSVRHEIDSSRIVKGKRTYREINRSDDWIYPRSLGFVEMYEGMLLAADTLRSLGLNIKLNVYDVSGDSASVVRLIRSGKLDRMDLIIGPVHSYNLSIVASYAEPLGIPVISPVQLGNNNVLMNHPFLFMASPSLGVAQKAIAHKMREYVNDNIVLIHSQSPQETSDLLNLYSEIERELDSLAPYQTHSLKRLAFISRSSLKKDSADRLAFSMSQTKRNIVILASEDTPAISESITDIHSLSRKYKINVFSYPSMRFLDNLDHKISFDLGLMVYSPLWIDYSANDVVQFNNDFRSKFLTEPSEVSYAWQGYDLLYYFLSGISIHGKEFLNHPEIHNPDLLHTEYDFRRNRSTDGFENNKLYLVRYSNSYDLELIEDEVAQY